jgi:signal transduction histidine kinase
MDWIEVRIQDDGPGMNEETLARAFDPFFTTRRQGTGLGLAICQTIVQEHAGRIVLDSAPGRGTVALVDLPVEKRAGQRRRS